MNRRVRATGLTHNTLLLYEQTNTRNKFLGERAFSFISPSVCNSPPFSVLHASLQATAVSSLLQLKQIDLTLCVCVCVLSNIELQTSFAVA